LTCPSQPDSSQWLEGLTDAEMQALKELPGIPSAVETQKLSDAVLNYWRNQGNTQQD
jgi:hypothetical protein